jgi:hypothetical protein
MHAFAGGQGRALEGRNHPIDGGSREMTKPNVLDTFPAFDTFWKEVEGLPVHRQINLWEAEYMARWPELLAKQIECYSSEGADWKSVARTHVFPYLGNRLGRMRALHRDLLRSLPTSWTRTRKVLDLRFSVRFVIYVGIGCGAGWATTYCGRPACLFGLENAAENHDGGDGWPRRVVAHEVAHLAHQKWRGERWEELADPWWKLYEEGFATYCERKVEPEAFPLRTGKKNWLRWCDAHRAWLARRFLQYVKARRSLRPFFGSWFNIEGQIETGYYLGSEVIRELVGQSTLRQVAVLSTPEIRRQSRAALERFAR